MTTTEHAPLDNLQFENPETYHGLDDRLQEVLSDLNEVLEESGIMMELENLDEIRLVNYINELIG